MKHQADCKTIADPECGPCTCPAPSALSREQLKEWMYRHQQASIARQKYRETSQTLDRQFAYDAELQELEEGLVAHDAAQRATIAQQAQEIADLKQRIRLGSMDSPPCM